LLFGCNAAHQIRVGTRENFLPAQTIGRHNKYKISNGWVGGTFGYLKRAMPQGSRAILLYQ